MGHEMLDNVLLIHMTRNGRTHFWNRQGRARRARARAGPSSGRVYDPVIGRFQSRDPFIDGLDSSQGSNGYAYVWNNPLSRGDPSGFGDLTCTPDPNAVVTSCAKRLTPPPPPSGTVLIYRGGNGNGGNGGGGGRGSGQGGSREPSKEIRAEPIPPDRVTCQASAVQLTDQLSQVAEPIADANIAAAATRATVARGFAVVSAVFGVYDLGQGIATGNNTQAYWGAADVVMSIVAFSGPGTPAVAVYFTARFVMDMAQLTDAGPDCP